MSNVPIYRCNAMKIKEKKYIFRFRYALAFLTPGLPFIPTIAITVNIYLIFKLSILTLVRFTIWMSLGLIMYFYYGITHSTLENPSEEIELTVDQTYLQPSAANNDHHQTTAVWDRHGYENKMADDSWSQSNFGSSWTSKPASKTNETSLTWGDERTSNGKSNPPKTANEQSSAAKPQGGFGIFVDESQFPSWDD